MTSAAITVLHRASSCFSVVAFDFDRWRRSACVVRGGLHRGGPHPSVGGRPTVCRAPPGGPSRGHECLRVSSTRVCTTAADVDAYASVVPPSWRDVRAEGAEVTVNAASSSSASSSHAEFRRHRLVTIDKTDARAFRLNSRSRLTARDARRFPGDDIFSRVARAVCDAQCLPRKELFETWEAARVISDAFGPRMGHLRVLDMGAGHGLLAWMLLVLHPECPSAVCVDRRQPRSHEILSAALVSEWPRLREPNEWLRSLALRAGRVRFVTARVEGATPSPGTLLVSVHACGGLTDLLLRMAVDSSAPVAVVPCCHQRDDAWNEVLGGSEPLPLRPSTKIACDSQPSLSSPGASFDHRAFCSFRVVSYATGLERKLGVSMPFAMDVARLEGLRAKGYDVRAGSLPKEVTPVNRVILGAPGSLTFEDGSRANAGAGSSSDAEIATRAAENGCSAGVGWESIDASLPESPWRRYAQPPA